jgi:hypothetical protein
VEIFNGIFTIDPENRMSTEEMRKYIFFQPERKLLTSASTESESGDEESMFEKDKLQFLD